jgi:hypothetical protein
VLHEFTNNSEEVRTSLPSIHPSSRSAIVEGISMALAVMEKARNERRILWVISNGGNDASPGAQTEIARHIRESGVEVFPVRSHEQIVPGYLTITPLNSIGLRFLPEPSDMIRQDALLSIMPISKLPDEAAILTALARQQYRIEYTPKNAARDGARRTLEVKLSVPEPLSTAFTVHYPKHYYAAFACEHCPNLPPNW